MSTAAAILLTAIAAIAQVDAPAAPPNTKMEAIHVERDLDYAGHDNPRQTLDVLLPERAPGGEPLPAVVNIHGGAWLAGDKSMGLNELLPLVASGHYVGVSINYRLTAEAIWPAQIHDAKAALRWVRAHAEDYGIDPDRIGVIGASAGGHLVALLGLTGGDAALEGDVGPHSEMRGDVQAVVDLFGPVDLIALPDDGAVMDHGRADSPEGRLLGGAIADHPEAARAASPITHISPDDPPFLIIHGRNDPIIPHVQSERFLRALRDKGVTAHLVTVTGGGHGGFANSRVNDRIRAFFDHHLRGIPEEPADEAIPNVPPGRGSE